MSPGTRSPRWTPTSPGRTDRTTSMTRRACPAGLRPTGVRTGRPTGVRTGRHRAGFPAAGGRGRRERGGHRDAERGSVTVFVVFFAMVGLALASLLVDVGNAVNAQERAADLAEQAARAAANAISVADLRSGTVVIDQTRACADAMNLIQAYVQTSRVDAA